jgi:long-chain acyl-CoA synthetase
MTVLRQLGARQQPGMSAALAHARNLARRRSPAAQAQFWAMRSLVGMTAPPRPDRWLVSRRDIVDHRAFTASAVAKAHPPTSPTPHYMEYQTLVDMHLVTREAYAERPLFGTRTGDGWRWITYREFGGKVDALRAALSSLGLKRGDTIACISNNREEWAVCAYATYSLGAQFVPMYEQQRPKEWQYIVEDAGAKAIFVANDEIYRQTYHFAGVVGDVKHVISFEPANTSHSLSSLLASHHPAAPAFLPHPEDLATIIYTSGTTGKPKGVQLSHRNIVSQISGLREILPEDLVSCYDRSLSFLPWAHCYGQTAELHALMAHGASLGIAEGIDKIASNLTEVKPTVLYAVPTLFKKIYDGVHAKVHASGPTKQWLFRRALQVAHHNRMYEEQGWAPSTFSRLQHKVLDSLVLAKIRNGLGGNLKVSFVGGAATPLEVLKFFENLGIKICEGYGLTETSPLVSINSPDSRFRKLGSTGRPLGGVLIRICAPGSTEEVPSGEEGEVCVTGPNIMKGYRNNVEATAEVLFDLGGSTYFRTGDLGKMEGGQYLYITGRLKEQFKLENGKYVVPGPVEAALQGSKYIQQALLYGDNKPYCIALLVPDWDKLRLWAEERGAMPEGGLDALKSSDAVKHLMAGEVQSALAGFKKFEMPRKWHLLDEGFTQEKGMLTPKLSVKRHVVVKVHSDDIFQLYGGEVLPREDDQLPQAA